MTNLWAKCYFGYPAVILLKCYFRISQSQHICLVLYYINCTHKMLHLRRFTLRPSHTHHVSLSHPHTPITFHSQTLTHPSRLPLTPSHTHHVSLSASHTHHVSLSDPHTPITFPSQTLTHPSFRYHFKHPKPRRQNCHANT
jgi:hypothetical protein